MIKIKPILPSLREKPRYIIYKILGNASKDYVYRGIKQCLGEFGMARAGVQMIDKNIIRTNSKYVDEVKSALLLIKNLDIIKVSGLLNKVKKFGG